MPNRKLFIGSSGESLHIAEDVKNIILASFRNIDVVTWKETPWANLTSILENLNNYTNEFYYSVFIGYPDDIVYERGKYYYISRDNVLFEFGYFLSIMGVKRTFLMLPSNFNYNGKTPIQLSSCGITTNPEFKILTDIGSNLITSRYDISYEIEIYTDPYTGADLHRDKWMAPNLSTNIASLISSIKSVEDDIASLKANASEELKTRGESLVSEVKKLKSFLPEQIINKFKHNIDQLLFLRSVASKKQIWDTVTDVVELIYKIEDFLDIEQLSRKQDFNTVKKVWVFADNPIEFDSKTEDTKRDIIIKKILTNLDHQVQYKYIVSSNFDTKYIDNYLFKSILDDDKKSIFRQQISVVQIDPKYFKTYFTLHFSTLESDIPDEIYMSALLPDRDDLLVKISKAHFDRVFERINKLVGYKHVGNYEVYNYVVKDK